MGHAQKSENEYVKTVERMVYVYVDANEALIKLLEINMWESSLFVFYCIAYRERRHVKEYINQTCVLHSNAKKFE